MVESSAFNVGKPCLFVDMGKRTKDLIQKGFNTGHMLLASCITPGGTTLSTTAIINEGIVLGIVSSSFKGGRVKTDLSATSLNQITAGTTYEDLVPGLNLSLITTVPGSSDQGKAQLVYQHNSASLTATMQGFKSKPSLELTANVGSERLSMGASLAYDAKSNCFTDTTAGLGYMTPELSAALFFNPKNDKSINAYCSHEVTPYFSWGCHLNHQLENNIHTATVGGAYKPDVLTTVKARMDNHGVVGASIQYEPKPLVTVGISAEINAKFLKTAKPNVGLSFSVLAA